jgi:hypothetical protein
MKEGNCKKKLVDIDNSDSMRNSGLCGSSCSISGSAQHCNEELELVDSVCPLTSELDDYIDDSVLNEKRRDISGGRK